MNEGYRLSAGALLYAVRLLHKPRFYGVPNVMPALSDPAFPAFVQAAETELTEAGCGTLNFDGVFALNEDFAALLAACAGCAGVAGASLRAGGGPWRKLTLYPSGAVLERAEDFTCTLRAAARPAQALLDALALPEGPPAPLPEVLADTDLLERRDAPGLVAAGCTEAQAALVLDALRGAGGYAHLRRTQGRACTGELLLFYGAAGILSATAEYSQTQEFLRLAPLTRAEALARVQALAEATAEQEDTAWAT